MDTTERVLRQEIERLHEQLTEARDQSLRLLGHLERAEDRERAIAFRPYLSRETRRECRRLLRYAIGPSIAGSPPKRRTAIEKVLDLLNEGEL